MKVTISTGRVHSVEITGDFTGPYINLELSPDDAYALLRALEMHRDVLIDMTENYYTCRDCGETHAKSVKKCPNIDTDD